MRDSLTQLFNAAQRKQPFDYICSLLRVRGITQESDPLADLEESLLSDPPSARAWYCAQGRAAEEMFIVVENLARILREQPFDIYPFQSEQSKPVIVRSETDLLRDLVPMAERVASSLEGLGYASLAAAVQTAFSEQLLQGCLGDGGPENLAEDLETARQLFAAFSDVYWASRRGFGSVPRLMRLPGFEVLELLTDEAVGLSGFRLHFSNGEFAEFVREREKSDARNILPDVPLTFSVGRLDALREEWRIGDRRLHEIGMPGRYNRLGEWQPLIFPEDPAALRREAREAHSDPDVQGAFFYVLVTGHRILEFALAMRVELPSSITYAKRIHLYKCLPLETETERGLYIYDGWVELDEISPAQISAALATVARLCNRLALTLDTALEWTPKYSFRPGGGAAVWIPGEEDLPSVNQLLTGFDAGAEGEALDVAVDWYNRGHASASPFASFLCFYIAIESIVQAIFEGEARFGLNIHLPTRAERSEDRRRCIDEKLRSIYEKNPQDFVVQAYFDCIVGATARTKRVVSAVFGDESRVYKALFDSTDENPALSQIRSRLAHGQTSELAGAEAQLIRERVNDVRSICRDFLLRLILRLQPMDALPPWTAMRQLSASFDDPRNIEVASSPRGLPTTDWRIRSEWIS